jgi:hypothetical protein
VETTDLTIEILKGIRDEGRKTNERIDALTGRVDALSGRVDAVGTGVVKLREELSQRIVHSEIRTSTAIAALAGDVRELTSFLRQTNDLPPRVQQCKEDIASIKQRLG